MWSPAERPDWLKKLNSEADVLTLPDVVPLEAEELIHTACRSLGLSDFGDDHWREPFEVLVKALNEEAELNLFGRLFTRDELLRALKVRLQIEDTYKRHPEIDDEVVHAPVVIAGLPRTGTSILFELLASDPRFGPLLSWEITLPCPPPEAATYFTDLRIEQAQRVLTIYDRATPEFRAMHEAGARLPNECGEAFIYSFMSENLATRVDVPSYMAWFAEKGDWNYAYRYHHRLLKLLQWKNPRKHWLLKSPSHLWHLPELFAQFPDARVIQTHRDPLRSNASTTSLVGTLRWMRSDKPFDSSSFEKILTPEATAASLNLVIDQMEGGIIPRIQMFDVLYEAVIDRPLDALRILYAQMGMELDADTEQRVQHYLDEKPKHKFGAHKYQLAEGDAERSARACFARYQKYYGIANEP